MQQLAERWQEQADQRFIFLRCYAMMTSNMLGAIERQEFADCAWVYRLLHRFADYYFVALDDFERDPSRTPQVWSLAHGVTRDPKTWAIQQLLLGVNAHINYDLVLTLVDLLEPEWAADSPRQRELRYLDHCRVNEVIGSTIDAVQDEVLEPAMPVLALVDQLLGRVDERLISRLIRNWRESVWQDAVRLLDERDQQRKVEIVRNVEREALRRGELIRAADWGGILADLR
jgi:hypothetical protein